MTVYVLGAGPTGLALVQDLAEKKQSFVLLEGSSELGGMATSIAWKNYGWHDLGPHKIFTTDKNLLQKVKNLLRPEEWLKRPKTSRIYMKGYFLSYPPSPFSLLNVYGPIVFLQMLIDFGMAKLKRKSKQEALSFKDDLVQRVGHRLYQALFAPIALKLWGNPEVLDSKLSKGRIQTPNIMEIVLNLLKIRKKSNFEALDFDYPQGGLIKLWKSIQAKAENQGEFHTQTQITKLHIQDQRITQIDYVDINQKQEHSISIKPEDFIFSSLPLQNLNKILELPQSIQQDIDQSVLLNDLLLVFIKMEQVSLFPESWVFVPDPEMIFHRISEQESFDPGMTPSGGILCCEIMDHANKGISTLSEEQIIEKIKTDLKKMGYNPTLQDFKIIKLKKSYPVYQLGFENRLNRILKTLDQIQNFKTIGRTGSFNYIGTLDCMDIGFGAARWYLNGKKYAEWEAERERTKHYPVLD